MAYRSSVQETTGYTPSMLMFGRELGVPVDVMFGMPANSPQSQDEFVCDIRSNLQYLY